MSKLFNLELLIEKLKKNSAISLTEKEPNEPYHSYSYNKETGMIRQIEIKDPPIYDHRKTIWDPSEVAEPEFLIGVNLESPSIIQGMIYFLHDGYTDFYPLLEDLPTRNLTGISTDDIENVFGSDTTINKNKIRIPFRNIRLDGQLYNNVLVEMDIYSGQYTVYQLENMFENPTELGNIIESNENFILFFDSENYKIVQYNFSGNKQNLTDDYRLFPYEEIKYIHCTGKKIAISGDSSVSQLYIENITDDTQHAFEFYKKKAYLYYNSAKGIVNVADKVFDLLSGDLFFTIPSNVSLHAFFSFNNVFYVLYYISNNIEIHEITESGTSLLDTIVLTEEIFGGPIQIIPSEKQNNIYILYKAEPLVYHCYSYNFEDGIVTERNDLIYPDFLATTFFNQKYKQYAYQEGELRIRDIFITHDDIQTDSLTVSSTTSSYKPTPVLNIEGGWTYSEDGLQPALKVDFEYPNNIFDIYPETIMSKEHLEGVYDSIDFETEGLSTFILPLETHTGSKNYNLIGWGKNVSGTTNSANLTGSITIPDPPYYDKWFVSLTSNEDDIKQQTIYTNVLNNNDFGDVYIPPNFDVYGGEVTQTTVVSTPPDFNKLNAGEFSDILTEIKYKEVYSSAIKQQSEYYNVI